MTSCRGKNLQPVLLRKARRMQRVQGAVVAVWTRSRAITRDHATTELKASRRPLFIQR